MDLVQGNPTEVKVVLASVATALAAYQVVLAAIGCRKLRIIEAAPAFMTHRASGDTIAVLLIVVAIMCPASRFLPAVTAQLGPTSAAELEAQEERLEQQEERREDREDR